jgi:hypothetical protein
MPRRMNGGEHGDVDITRGITKELCRLLLAAGRNRVDVEEEWFCSKMCLDRLRRFDTRRGGDGGNDDICPAHRIRCRIGATHAARLRRLPELLALALRKQNVPRRHPFYARFAQPGGDGLAGLTEADECDSRLPIWHRH